jgi:hypothetical protein
MRESESGNGMEKEEGSGLRFMALVYELQKLAPVEL